LFHLVDVVAVGQSGRGSATPAMTVLVMAILLTAVAWSPTLGSGVPEVDLPAIVVSGPPLLDPLFESDAAGAMPVSFDVSASSGLFPGGLWSDARRLLFEYSPMSGRNRGRTDSGERVLRRTGLD